MPFDWMHAPTITRSSDAWRNQYVSAVRERAQLLCNLKYPAKIATRRIQENLSWEFDSDIATTPRPSFYKTIPKLVKEVYAHTQVKKQKAKGKRSK